MRRMRTPTDIRCLSFSRVPFLHRTVARDIQKITGLNACANSLAKSFRAGLDPRVFLGTRGVSEAEKIQQSKAL